jgi:acetyl/propionyl-CoA carboxylase alpha subunit
MSFNSVLVANRGEIALRIIEACRELGVVSIAVCSEADARMPYLKLADASVCIGPPEPARSYLNIAAIISAAELTGAEAIHPGYGFLAENPHFVEVCEEHGLVFVGPPREVMALLGDKLAAREAAARAGVSVLPGEPVPPDSADLPDAGERVGYPLWSSRSTVVGGGGCVGSTLPRNSPPPVVPRPRRRGRRVAMPVSTWKGLFPTRDTWRYRFSPMGTDRWFTSASESVRFSDAIRS